MTSGLKQTNGDGDVIPRKSLIVRLETWFTSNVSTSKSEVPNNSVLILSAPKGTGKSTALRNFAQNKQAVYYEFHPGQLRKEQTATECLLAGLDGLLKGLDGHLNEDPAQVSRKTKPNPAYVDAQTLFDKFIAKPLIRLGSVSLAGKSTRLLFIVDGPERCDPSSRGILWDILCRRWGKLVPGDNIRLIVCTSMEVASIPVFGGGSKVCGEIVTRLSSKGDERDEVIWSMFERVVAAGGDDPEWETEKIGNLTRLCNGSLFLARYILAKNWLDKSPLPENAEEVFKQEYRPGFGPLLCARRWPIEELKSNRSLLRSPSVKEDLDPLDPVVRLLLESNAFIDWFCLRDKERLRKEGHAAAFSLLASRYHESSYAARHSLFHAMESGDVDAGRGFLVEFDKLYRFAQADAELLLLDAEIYCQKRPNDMACRVVKNCLLQSRKGILKDPRQLPFQLLARITGVASEVRGDVDISNLLSACRHFKSSDFYWFRPIRASMQLPPETTLKVMRGHADTILAVSCTPLDSPCPRVAITGSCDGTAKLFDLQTGRCELTLYNQGGGYCSGVSLAVLNESLLVAITSTEDCNSRLWYIAKTRNQEGSSVDYYYRVFTDISEPELSSNEKSGEMDGPAHILIGHTKELTGCSFMPGSAQIAVTCSADGTAKLWELPLPGTSKEIVPVCRQTFVGHEQPVLCVAFVPPQYQMLATGSKDRTIRMWSLQGQCLSVFSGHFSNVTCMAFRNDGLVLATGGWDSLCKVWSVSEVLNQQLVDPSAAESAPMVEEKCMLVHKDWIWGVAFLETDRDLLATGADNGVVRLWSISSSSCILAFDAHLGLGVYCIAPMGSDFIVTGGIDSTLRLFDVSKARCTGRNTVAESWTAVDALHRHQAVVRCAAFPAQNLKRRFCFLGSDDKNIKAFDLDTGRCAKRLPEKHKAALRDIFVSHDESELKSVDDAGKSIVWNRATFDVKNERRSWLGPTSILTSCVSPCLGPTWRQTGIWIESELNEGHLQVPESIREELLLSDEEAAIGKPFIPLSFDTSLRLNCWCSPPSVNMADYVANDDQIGPKDPVLVVTEANGLVHFLHPMI